MRYQVLLLYTEKFNSVRQAEAFSLLNISYVADAHRNLIFNFSSVSIFTIFFALNMMEN